MKFLGRFLWLVVFVLVLLFANSSPVSAQDSSLNLTVTPAALALAPNETETVLVTATLPSEGAQTITLSAFTDTAVQIQIAEPTRTNNPVRGIVGWQVTLTRPSQGIGTGAAFFRADYNTQNVPGVSTITLALSERPQDKIEEIVTARIDSALAKLQERQPQFAYLVITNISNVPVTITQIQVDTPPFVSATIETPYQNLQIAPQQAVPFRIKLDAGEQVQSGKHLVIIQIGASWERNGQKTTGSLVVNKEFTVGVPLESDILGVIGFTALGIASLYLLPGFLFVTTFLFLYKRVRPKQDLLDARQPEFWMFAVLFSLLAILFYPILSAFLFPLFLGRTTAPRDLLSSYGLNDIYVIWFGALAAGLTVYVLFLAARFALAQVITQWRSARIPTENDLPLQALTKIALNRGSLEPRVWRYEKNASAQNVYELASGYTELGKKWIAPAIRVRFSKATDEDKEMFDAQLTRPADVEAMRDLLEKWERAGTAKTEWDTRGALVRHPTLVEVTAVQPPTTGTDSFVQEA